MPLAAIARDFDKGDRLDQMAGDITEERKVACGPARSRYRKPRDQLTALAADVRPRCAVA